MHDKVVVNLPTEGQVCGLGAVLDFYACSVVNGG